MIQLIYLFFLLGSFSPGYMLLRLGFPLTQNWGNLKKIGLGYLLGILVFGLPVIIMGLLYIDENYFNFISISLAILIFLAALFLVKRIALKEKDLVFVTSSKKKKLAEEQEENLNERIPAQNKKVIFEQGLVVKSRGEETKKQVFKEKTANISKESLINNEKEEALEKLRKSAKQIKKPVEKEKNKTSEKNEKVEEIEEGLLSEIGEEQEEEYL